MVCEGQITDTGRSQRIQGDRVVADWVIMHFWQNTQTRKEANERSAERAELNHTSLQ